jgi:hypothetical protein
MKASLFTAGILTGLLLAGLFVVAYHPSKVYSFSPQIFPTGIEVDESVNAAGSGLKHGRTGSIICSHTGCGAQINWPGTAFPDTNYTAVCSLESGPLQETLSVAQKATTFVFVDLPVSVLNKGVVVDCIAMHD